MGDPIENAIIVTWLTKNRKAQCPPDANFPNGKDIDIAGDFPSCQVDIPYPAPECGTWIVKCAACGLSIGVTAAGRPDDPKSIKIACRGGRANNG